MLPASQTRQLNQPKTNSQPPIAKTPKDYYHFAMIVVRSVVKWVHSTEMPRMWIVPTRDLHIDNHICHYNDH